MLEGRRARFGVAIALAWLLAPAVSGAQAPRPLPPDRVRLSAEAELVPLAEAAAAVLQRRTSIAIVVGTWNEPGGLRLESCGDAICLRLGARDRESRISPEEATPQTLAFAIEVMVDDPSLEPFHALLMALDGAIAERATEPPRAPRRARTPSAIAPPASREPDPWEARPAFFMRLLLGYEPGQNEPLVGPGAGFGLCVGRGCVVAEADLAVVPRTRDAFGHRLRYFSLTGALRFHLRPLEIGRFSLGATFGLFTRLFRVSVNDLGNRSATTFGVRMSVEGAVRLKGPLELVFELGGDHVLDSEALYVAGQGVHLESGFRPWMTMALRFRPRVR
ncbi:MAG: hypothetical protein AAF411_20275 [Myxococcota bacterium]